MCKIADRIAVNPQVMHGKPVIAGRRVPDYLILNLLAGGSSPESVLAEYPGLTIEDVQACLAYAARGHTPEVS